MKQNIWILNHYAGGTLQAKGGRHYWFADYLQREGYRPVVFCCNVTHNPGTNTFQPSNALWTEILAEEIQTPYVYIRARRYSDNGSERLLNMLDFFHNVKKAAKEYSSIHGKPDLILASSVHPLTLVAGIQLAKHFRVKCICEVRDFWPEALVAYSRKLQRLKPVTGVLYAGEKWIYKRADALIFTQEGGTDYIRNHRWDLEQGGPIDMEKIHYINNGVDLEAFDRNRQLFTLDDPDLEDPETFKVIYAGSVRRVNDLGLIVEAAKELRNPRIRILIYGSGDQLDALRQRTETEHISNIRFKGQINKQYIPFVLSKADVNLAHWQMTPLLRLGESCNKTFEYLAAGKPIYYTVRPNYSIVEKYKCGCITPGFSPREIAEGLDRMASLPQQELIQMEKNARFAAGEYDFASLTKRLIQVIESL